MRKIVLCLAIVFVLCGCNKIIPDRDTGKRIYSTFADMQSYHAVLKVTTYSNNSKNTYDTNQFYKYPNKMRSETGEIVTVINGTAASVKNSEGMSPLTVSQISGGENDYMFLCNFFADYYKTESTEALLNSENNGLVMLSINTELESPYKNLAELTIDANSMKPVYLEIKGKDGKTYIHIDYIEFEINPALDDSMFEI